eukprot:GGOE01009967.1.p4 GENE.GGOE01009967.1~~GGOE01009967.1.p4  ORF type:complete len:156 (-),score=6.15 GGOE01009967.1:880-1347(-)
MLIGILGHMEGVGEHKMGSFHIVWVTAVGRCVGCCGPAAGTLLAASALGPDVSQRCLIWLKRVSSLSAFQKDQRSPAYKSAKGEGMCEVGGWNGRRWHRMQQAESLAGTAVGRWAKDTFQIRFCRRWRVRETTGEKWHGGMRRRESMIQGYAKGA